MGGLADIWIYGYGSLMWDPGFAHVERRAALLRGYHRAFCVYSRRYRGTPERPGLVLGLERSGSCRGIAFRIDPAHRVEIFAYLHEREMTTYVYDQRQLPVELDDGRRVLAYTHVAVRDHPQYTGKLSVEETVRLICQGHGERGPCAEYLVNTVRHLDELGIKDGAMHALLKYVESRRGS